MTTLRLGGTLVDADIGKQLRERCPRLRELDLRFCNGVDDTTIAHLVGMPSSVTIDLTGLWHREVSITGRYAYTHEEFEQAFDVVRAKQLGRLVSATYPLDRFTDALQHAAEAGRRGATKIAFDLRTEKERNR